jgi:D-glycero-D-manno-heptose 1,7-bisphosphate phosphatase
LTLPIVPIVPDDECDCRKPEPKMILDLANKHHIDLQESYMIGDKMSDVECGQNAGAKGILINTQKLDTNVELIFDTLSEIADYLENQAR